MGDLFESNLPELLAVYHHYCILWVEIEANFTHSKLINVLFAKCIIEFETEYGNTVEHFLELIAHHLSELYVMLTELLKHTNKDTESQEFTNLNNVSKQLQHFSDKIIILRTFKKDVQKQRLLDQPIRPKLNINSQRKV